jgi:hypothetical protein
MTINLLTEVGVPGYRQYIEFFREIVGDYGDALTSALGQKRTFVCAIVPVSQTRNKLLKRIGSGISG